MKRTGLGLWVLLGVAVTAQLSAPLAMIGQRELTLRTGAAFKFRTRPVDPYDVFQGRYVALSISNTVPIVSGEYDRGARVYAVIAVGPDGFATFTGLSPRAPASGSYVRTRVQWAVTERDGMRATIRIPFDRYYLSEHDAPRAETAYREHSRRGSQDAYLVVRVRNGSAVLADLVVGGKPIREFLASQP